MINLYMKKKREKYFNKLLLLLIYKQILFHFNEELKKKLGFSLIINNLIGQHNITFNNKKKIQFTLIYC